MNRKNGSKWIYPRLKSAITPVVPNTRDTLAPHRPCTSSEHPIEYNKQTNDDDNSSVNDFDELDSPRQLNQHDINDPD